MPLSETLARYHARAVDPLTGNPAITADAFQARATELSQTFNDLLDDDALGLLILDELGLNEGAIVTLTECAGRAEASVRVRIDRIEAPREYDTQKGTGRVGNIAVSDPTGTARLTLWNKDVNRIDDREFAEGDVVRVLNARIKDTRWGLELHVGQWTALEVEGAMDPAKRKLLTDVDPKADPTRYGPGTTHLETHRRDDAATSSISSSTASSTGSATSDAPAASVISAATAGAATHSPSASASSSTTTTTTGVPAAQPTSAHATRADAVLDPTRPAPEMPLDAPTFIGALVAEARGIRIVATVHDVKPTRSFQRQGGGIGFVANAAIADDTGRIILAAWDDYAKEVATWKPGDKVDCTELVVKDRYGVLELHTSWQSALKRQ